MLEFYDYNFYMTEVLKLAERGKPYTLTNPLVGALIVKDDIIIGKGYHKKYGDLHAEINAIKDAEEKGESVEGSTLYVNLEPCCHYGKQGPCTQVIIDKKIKKVVIANVDPNPKVSGKGIRILEDAGIEVVEGIMEEEGLKLNEAFFHYIKTNKPFVTLKSAMTLDGKISSITGDSKWISSDVSRTYTHRLRAENNAIMVGIGTVLADDPLLNVRLEGDFVNPIKIILDSKLRIPIGAKLFSSSQALTIIAHSKDYDVKKYKILKEKKNVELISLNYKDGFLDLEELMEKLRDFNICSILLEGGGNLNFSMLNGKLVDKVLFFIAPKFIGGKALSPVSGQGIKNMKDAIKLRDLQVEKMGPDVFVSGYIEKED